MDECKHGEPIGECPCCYANGLHKLTGCDCNQRMVRSLEAIHRISGDMLNEEKRRGPSRDVCCVQENRRGRSRPVPDVKEGL